MGSNSTVVPYVFIEMLYIKAYMNSESLCALKIYFVSL